MQPKAHRFGEPERVAGKGAELDAVDGRGRTPITTANQLPIDTAVTLLVNLIEATGKTPKQSPKR